MILDAIEWWNGVWQSIVDFFTVPDVNGIAYWVRILFAIVFLVIGWLIIKLLTLLLNKAFGLKKKGPDLDVSAKFFIVTLIKIFLWVCIFLLVVTVLKLDVTGVAGMASAVTVALGLALQDVIACFAYGVLILQQKTFVTGEYVSIQNSYGTCEGTVSKVHFFFTYLRTINGQDVIVPNLNVAKAVVTNYSRLGKRRLNYDIGVAYNSDIELVKKVLREIAESDERVIKDGTLIVYVCELGSYSVVVRLRCWLKSDVYWPFYYELPEKVLMKFRENGIYIPSSTDRQVSSEK